jgi:hypothetical protein
MASLGELEAPTPRGTDGQEPVDDKNREPVEPGTRGDSLDPRDFPRPQNEEEKQSTRKCPNREASQNPSN